MDSFCDQYSSIQLRKVKMRSKHLLAASLISIMLLLGHASDTKADLVTDLITITSYSSFSGDPIQLNVIVQDPGVEVPFSFASDTLISNLSVDVNASTIDILVESGLGIGFTPFQGLRFTDLDSPGEFISGVTVQSSIGGISGVFDPAAVTFGADFVNVDMQNTTNFQGYSVGDSISVALQFSAVPEPGSSSLMIAASSVALLIRRRTKR